jgi:hopene-associated glycosyltransferase HpnB
MSAWTVVALSALAVWLYLLVGRGSFWRASVRDEMMVAASPEQWPAVVAVVPARNEADVIARSVRSLLGQDYPGPFRIVVVDDGSSDGTAAAALQARTTSRGGQALDVISGAELPSGWTGKLWALEQGVRHAKADGAIDYFLLTDADVGHAPDNLRALVARAEHEGRVLVSLMAELSCTTWPERFLIPAFVFFFQMLYPSAGSRRTIAGRPPPPADACWSSAMPWSAQAGLPRCAPRSSTTAPWPVA